MVWLTDVSQAATALGQVDFVLPVGRFRFVQFSLPGVELEHWRQVVAGVGCSLDVSWNVMALHFDASTRSRRKSVLPRTRGIWMLLLMLGAVLMLMRQLQQQSAVDFLGRVFAPTENGVAAIARSERPPSASPAGNEKKAERTDEIWAAVKDNALFLPAEQAAWNNLLEKCRNSSTQDIAAESLGNVAYAQLVSQPDVYRGQPVRVRGTVLRESVKRAAENSLGLNEYHQLVLAPAGGGQWPIIVYCIDLPEGFPQGQGIREAASVDGYFFKNWSYPYDGGVGIAPVIVAKSLNWHGSKPGRPDQSPAEDSMSLALGSVTAMAIAVMAVVWVARQTRRPSTEVDPPDFSGMEV